MHSEFKKNAYSYNIVQMETMLNTINCCPAIYEINVMFGNRLQVQLSLS